VEDIRFHIDAALCMPHGIELGGVEVLSVFDHVKTVVPRDFGADERLQFVEELRSIDGVLGWLRQGIFQAGSEESCEDQSSKREDCDQRNNPQESRVIELLLNQIPVTWVAPRWRILGLRRQAAGLFPEL